MPPGTVQRSLPLRVEAQIELPVIELAGVTNLVGYG